MEDPDPVCCVCQATSSLMWQKRKDGAILCLECHNNDKEKSVTASGASSRTPSKPKNNGKAETSGNGGSNCSSTSETSDTSGQSTSGVTMSGTSANNTNGSQNSGHGRRTRLRERTAKGRQAASNKSTESLTRPAANKGSFSSSSQTATMSGNNGGPAGKPLSKTLTGGGGRRQLKLVVPQKAPQPRPMIVTGQSVIHKGTVYEVGDIVSVLDQDGGTYYALIKGFLQDQYSEKYAILTWLLPIHPNPTHFDPAAFVLGPEEDIPRSMELLDFVCHSPRSRHFQASFFHNIERAESWNGPLLPRT